MNDHKLVARAKAAIEEHDKIILAIIEAFNREIAERDRIIKELREELNDKNYGMAEK